VKRFHNYINYGDIKGPPSQDQDIKDEGENIEEKISLDLRK
jgi:hypothetical protein